MNNDVVMELKSELARRKCLYENEMKQEINCKRRDFLRGKASAMVDMMFMLERACK